MTILAQGGRPTVTVLLSSERCETIFDEHCRTRLAEAAHVVYPTGPPDEWDLPVLLREASVCLTGWGTPPLSEAVVRGAPRLRLVAHTAGSIRQLLPEGLVGSAVRVSSAAHVIADAVAEFTLLQILCSLRGLHVLDRDVRVGAWPGAADRNRGQLLAARTIGIIGGGRTGRAIVNLLHPFGSRILLCDPTWTEDAARRNSVELVDLDTLLTSCDVISLHAPLLPSTELMIGSSELAVMRDGALLVNSARAGLIDAPALLAELQQGRIRAALDVFPDEPLPADSEWCQWPGLLLSPHAAGHTVDSHLRQGAASVNEVLNFLRGDPLLYEVCADQTAMLA